ncbi:response regulator transcription factor [Cohnella luojiensis]|uniref:Helix-turn-helix domain-containing protein n=1 Tax=Cohnella luojiensis TaxID=652876 RepID=A0A4Y8LSD8_9BACL|nr:helix-turn-helix domain-containing protein [Cohnella luojiensis]TFE23769.1 helix-turn-helix domain-containing protein [Cohnella luojiensis]
MKAVIIDDEFWTRDSIRRLVDWEKFGIDQVEEAEEGLGGLKLIDEIHPDIVITDMKMRGMDGVELLRKLTDDYPFIRKIVISGFDDFVYTKQAILSKVDEYLLKPIHPDEINAAVEKAVRGLRAARGLHALQPMDAAFMKVISEFKGELSRHFLELRTEDVRSHFQALERALENEAALVPGINNLLYKQFMLLLGEQAAKADIELSSVLPEHAAAFFVTDDTPFGQIIGVLADSYAAVLEEAVHRIRSKQRIDISDIRQFIDNAYAQPITLESIAHRFFVSKEHLSRMFKQETGFTVMDYIASKRIAEARQLLQSGLPIKNAAEAVGYADPAYFHRIFKKLTGMTPSQVRLEAEQE